jgi:hypothetical protein
MLAHYFGDLAEARVESTNRALLVQRRKAAETGNIGGKDGCELSIHSSDCSGGVSYRWMNMRGFCQIHRVLSQRGRMNDRLWHGVSRRSNTCGPEAD